MKEEFEVIEVVEFKKPKKAKKTDTGIYTPIQSQHQPKRKKQKLKWSITNKDMSNSSKESQNYLIKTIPNLVTMHSRSLKIKNRSQTTPIPTCRLQKNSHYQFRRPLQAARPSPRARNELLHQRTGS